MSLPALRLLPGADVSAPAPTRPPVATRAPALRLVVAWPAAPMPVVARPALTPFMQRCLLLALLLHVWLVLMLGNAPGGTAAPGQGVAGTLNITLRGPETPGATEPVAPPAPAVPEGPTGTAAQPRWGGQVRSQAPVAVAAPGAAQLGRWSAEPVPVAPAPSAEVPPGRVVEERSAADTEPPTPAAPARAPAPAPALADTPVDAPAPAPPSAPADTLATLRAAPIAAPLPPAWAPLPTEAPVALSAVAERSLLAPAASALPAPAPALEPLPPAPALPALAVDAPPVAPLLQRLARPPAPVVEPAAVPALAREPAQPAPAPLALPAMPALQQPLAAAEPAAAAPAAALPAPGAAPPAPGPAAPEALPPARAGQPDAGPQLGRDVATPPAPAASVLPRLNLQLQRPRGGELSRGRSAGALPVLPRLPEVDEKLGRDIAKSAKADCREAYRGGGLAAAVPLVADALKKDSGCKW